MTFLLHLIYVVLPLGKDQVFTFSFFSGSKSSCVTTKRVTGTARISPGIPA